MAKPLPLLVVMLVVASPPWCPVSTPPPGNANGDINLSAPSLVSLENALNQKFSRNSQKITSPFLSNLPNTWNEKKNWKFHNVFEAWLSSCSTAPGQIQSKTLTQSTKPSCHRVFFDCSSRCLKIGKHIELPLGLKITNREGCETCDDIFWCLETRVITDVYTHIEISCLLYIICIYIHIFDVCICRIW